MKMIDSEPFVMVLGTEEEYMVERNGELVGYVGHPMVLSPNEIEDGYSVTDVTRAAPPLYVRWRMQ